MWNIKYGNKIELKVIEYLLYIYFFILILEDISIVNL